VIVPFHVVASGCDAGIRRPTRFVIIREGIAVRDEGQKRPFVVFFWVITISMNFVGDIISVIIIV
jgi:hypothetical protein